MSNKKASHQDKDVPLSLLMEVFSKLRQLFEPVSVVGEIFHVLHVVDVSDLNILNVETI